MRVPTRENALVPTAVAICGKNSEIGPDQSLSCPHSRPIDHTHVGGHPKEVWWTATPSKGKDTDSRDSRKTFIIHLLFLYFDLFCSCFWIFFFFSFFYPLLLQLLILLVPLNLFKLLKIFSITLFISATYFCWPFVLLWGFYFLFFSLYVLIFKNLLVFSTFILLFAFPTALFSLQIIFNIY